MILMVFLTVAIFGVLALSLDMGYTYYNRRWAQNAADSGALAAARELCIDTDPATRFTNATNAAVDYVESKNLAFGVNSQTMTNICFRDLDLNDGTCNCMIYQDPACPELQPGEAKVDVAINHPNFVANFFGRNSTTVPATAAAGCFAPGAAFGVVPIAWKCNVILDENGEDVCDMTFISDDDECIYTEDYMYIFIEADKKLFWCDELGVPPTIPPGSEVIHMMCGDNLEIVNTAQPVHSWAWVDLNGSSGQSCATSELNSWVVSGFAETLSTHTWVPSCGGSHTDIFGSVGDLEKGAIPIFDMICESNDARNDCDGSAPPLPDLWHDGIDTDLPLVTASQYTFHLNSFALLKISCVDAQGNKCNQSIHARQALEDMNPGILQNIETIEGCFVGGFIPGLSGKPSDGVNAGAWTLYLTR
jgi:hypothetical protein